MPISEDQLAHTATQCGQLLRDRRKRLGISMAAAAEAAGMSRVTWHRIETGEASVSWRYVLASAQVLDLDVQLSDTGFPAPRPVTAVADAMLPVSVRLDDYPQLRRLAWQVGDRMQAITPREALGLYERNLRHLEPDTLEPAERALIAALAQVFDADGLRV